MKKLLIIGILLGTQMLIPAVMAETPPLKAGFIYSSDSDGVVVHSYNIGIASEEAPLNFTVYRTRLTQSGQTIHQNTLLGTWHNSIGSGALTIWAGYTKNDIRNAGTYAVMYDQIVAFDDHLWVSYGHDLVDTVKAHQKGITSNSATISFLHKPSADVDVNVQAVYRQYSDNNTQQIYNLAVDKKINNTFKIGLNYGYCTAEHAASPDYYVPLNEDVLSIKPELTLSIGQGKLKIDAEQALTGHSYHKATRRHSLETAVTFGKFTVGTKYFSDVEYNSRSAYINWTSNF